MMKLIVENAKPVCIINFVFEINIWINLYIFFNDLVWITSAMGLERFGVAFLPVNPALSAPRNQGRQKLARLSAAEMAALLRDILMDASRRQHIATLKPNCNHFLSIFLISLPVLF